MCEGKLGGQVQHQGMRGTWKDLVNNVNTMAGNLSVQVRAIAEVTTAVARGDLSKKIEVDVKGEILELKNTINTMVEQLGTFAAEVSNNCYLEHVITEFECSQRCHAKFMLTFPGNSCRS